MWFEHNGKSMPVSGETLVLVRHRDGVDEAQRGYSPRRADFWLFGEEFNDMSNWSHDFPADGDIVAYKIMSQTETQPTMKIYLAGPMSNLPAFNFPAFHAAAAKLRAAGHYVFNPAEADISRSGVDPSVLNPTGDPNGSTSQIAGLSRRECLAADLAWIAAEGEAIALLPGWMNSSGAKAEKALADALNLQVIYLD